MENNEDKVEVRDKWKSNQYLEIYKLQVNVIMETSNRRVNVNRYYVLTLSVLILALSAILRGGDILVDLIGGSNGEEVLDKKIIGFALAITGSIGVCLSATWFRNILGYLHSNSNRYKSIKCLESQLEYQFTDSVWNWIPSEGKGSKINSSTEGTDKHQKSYFQLARHDLYAPLIFYIGFTFIAVFGLTIPLSIDSTVMIAIIITVLFSMGSLVFLMKFKAKE